MIMFSSFVFFLLKQFLYYDTDYTLKWIVLTIRPNFSQLFPSLESGDGQTTFHPSEVHFWVW